MDKHSIQGFPCSRLVIRALAVQGCTKLRTPRFCGIEAEGTRMQQCSFQAWAPASMASSYELCREHLLHQMCLVEMLLQHTPQLFQAWQHSSDDVAHSCWPAGLLSRSHLPLRVGLQPACLQHIKQCGMFADFPPPHNRWPCWYQHGNLSYHYP